MTLSEMRTTEGKGLSEATAYCPSCGCRRNGNAAEPNGTDEGCSADGQCPCHDGEAQ